MYLRISIRVGHPATDPFAVNSKIPMVTATFWTNAPKSPKESAGEGPTKTMHLLFTTDLGVKALVYMAASKEKLISIADMAETFEVKTTAFKRPLKTLNDNDIITSHTGRSGGYSLHRDPSTLSLGEIVAMLEQDFALVPWLEPDENGVVQHPNSIYRFAIEHAKTAFFAHLDNYTIADLAADPFTQVAFNIQHLVKKRLVK